jgi:hypothetical protein
MHAGDPAGYLEQLAIHERETGKGALQLAPQLLSDDKFLDHMVELTKRL